MARACSLSRHAAALARAPGRSARPHPGPGPLRLVLRGLVVVALVLAATLMPAVALAEEDDGAADTSGAADSVDTGSDEDAGVSADTSTGAPDSVGLANDEDPGISVGVTTSSAPGPVGATPAGATAPTQHEVAPPGPAGLPSGLPGPPATGIGSFPNMDTLGGLACCPTSGPGGNAGKSGYHESDD